VRTPAPASFFAFDEQVANIYQLCEAQTSDSQRLCTDLRTEDGGRTWQTLTAPSGYSTVVAFFDARRGVSAGPRWTEDGGNTWQDAQFPATMGFGAVSFVDDQHGWFAASKLLKTNDAGATWTAVSDRSFADLAFISGMEGWGTTTSPRTDALHITVLHTTDGGVSWQEQYNKDVVTLPRLFFTTPLDGWLLSEGGGRALHTRDGGVSWSEQTLPTVKAQDAPSNPNYGKAVFVGASTGWVAVPGCSAGSTNCRGHVRVTQDGGDHWTPAGDFGDGICYVSDISSTSVLDVRVVASTCAVTGSLYQSHDGGQTWSATPLGTSISYVTFFDAQIGRAIGSVCAPDDTCSSSVWRTSDGGTTWTTDGVVLPHASAVVFTSPDRLWLRSEQHGHWSSFSQRLYSYPLK